MNIFERIIQSRSMIAIDYMIEDALRNETEDSDIISLRNIYDANSIDLRHAFAHEMLGNHSQAYMLRTWKTLSKEDRLLIT